MHCTPTGCMWDYMTWRQGAGRLPSRRDRPPTAVARRRHRPGDDEQPLHPVRPVRPTGRQPPAGARPDHAAARLGRARRRRDPRARPDLRPGRAARGRRRCARARRGRDQQPARDDRRLVARTGRPVHNAIVWQDTRTAEAVRAAGGGGVAATASGRPTGLPISTYSTALKLAWILDDGGRSGDRGRAATCCSGRSIRGCIWHLTGGRRRWRPRDRRDERLAHDADGPRDARLGPGARSTRSGSRRDAARRSAPRPRSTGTASATSPACRSPATSATSRRRCSGRPASRPGR